MDVESGTWLELDRYVEQFEAARSRDDAADLRRFAPRPDDALYLPVLRELVRVDLEVGWSRGRPRPLADYQRLVPELFHDAGSLQAIAFEEYRLRQQHGQDPSPLEYRSYGMDTSDWPLSAAPAANGSTERDIGQPTERPEANGRADEPLARAASIY